ncbi:hypothetical protein AVEN_141658-1 [Araneus ventricosus]|uniref:DUF4817 domain-containing protein n=1 Tax=Araneus ventricosus TaxID=182803 RepID=A0A4Y2IR81_ARAVE|nr:hypothetical protein AVEN_141658-1 [Araneus ventricosus]
MSQYNNEELFEMLMLYSLCNRNANETAREFQRTFPNSWHPSGRFISRLSQRMRERGSVHPVGGLGALLTAVVDYGIGSLSTYHQLQTAEVKVVFLWCVDQELIASGYQCPKCKQQLSN